MYRTPARRGLSPDSPVSYRDSPHSRDREDSWSRGHSPDRRGRSPDRHGRSPDRRGRSRSRHRSRSRPGGHTRSKSRGRRSRSRPRRSPSPYSQYSGRRRSPGDSYRSEDREQHRPSSSGSDHRPLSSSHDRSSSIKSYGHDSSPLVYQSSGDSHASPLPMPKKSILKKRPDMEPSSCDQSPQVDMFSSVKDVRSASCSGAGKSVEKNNVTTESPHPMAVQMGLLNSSASSSSAQAVAQSPESPPPHGSTQPTAVSTNWTLITNTETCMKRSIMGQTPPREQTDSPKVTQYNPAAGNLFNKTAPKSQSDSFSSVNIFSEHKEAVQKGREEAGGFLLPYEQDLKSASLLSKNVDRKQPSSAEIEDEERFLYGDEEEKKPEPQKPPPGKIASAPPVKSAPNKQEFEKIHDLLKTIGLDIGVAEIGKLAVRTQERLHGKKAVPKKSQPEPLPSAAAAPPADTKAKVSEPQVKTETEKEGAEAAVQTVSPIKPAPKEPTPTVTPPNPAPAIKEKPQLIFRKPVPKETTPPPKVEVPVQPPIIPVPDPTPSPISPSQMPVYPQYPHHSPMVPAYNIPPPSYNPYNPYVSYPTSNWTMYSPMAPQPPTTHMPTPPPAPHMSVPVCTPAPVYNTRSNLRIIETTADLTDVKIPVKMDAKPTSPLAALLAKQEADRKNKENEKMKVLDELDFARREHKVKSESLKTLSAKVEQLRIQQGLLLRKKRREKDGHRDPLLEELNNVLESAQKQIYSLREEAYATKHKQHQLTKVAEILGVSPTELVEKSDPKKEERSPDSPSLTRDSDNESRTSNDSSKSANDSKTRSDPTSKIDCKSKSGSKSGADTKSLGATHLTNVTEKSEDVLCKSTPSPDPKNSPEPHSPYLSKSEDILKSSDTSRSKSPQPCTLSSKTPAKSEEPLAFDLSEIFEYYDSGSHWCEDCNAICMRLPEYLLHLHEKKHNQFVKVVKRPWVKKKVQEPSPKKQKVNVPLKGSEFLIPVNGFYCELCEELFPDHNAAEEHLRAYAHNDKYKKHTDAHINYEAVRREKKKTSLTIAQEAARKLAEQKRKIAEHRREEHERSRSKKAKKEQEDRKAKAKRHTSASPPSSDQKRNKTPEKEPTKNPAFGKFVWKGTENKTQAVLSSSKADTASKKPKEDEPKSVNLKTKAFAIKLLSKCSNLSGNALASSHSAAFITVATTASPASSSSPASAASATPASATPASATPASATPASATPAPAAPSAAPASATAASTTAASTTAASTTAASTTAASTTTTSTAQTKVRPDLPSVINIRPNLPSLMNVRSVVPMATLSKPAPLNTFLSIKSSNAASKSIPIVKNKPTGLLSEDLVSKAFGGEVVILKESTQPNSTVKTETKEHEKKTGQSPMDLQAAKGQDLFNVLLSEKETVENQEIKSEKESSVSKQLPLHSFSQKPSPVTTSSSHTTFSFTKPVPSPVTTSSSHTTFSFTKPVPSPVTTSASHISFSFTKPLPISGFAKGQQTQKTKSPVSNPVSSPVSSTTSVKSPINNSSNGTSNNAKLDFAINPSNQQAGKVEFTPSEVQKPQDAKTPSKLEKETPQEVKASTFSMNPATGRLEYLPVQETKVKDTNAQKVPETKHVPSTVTYVSSVKPSKLVSTPPAPVLKIKPAFNATTKLNQKFKKAPLSLPSSLFGHVQDPGYKDIKITSIESQKTNIGADKFARPLFPPAKKQVSSSPLSKPSPANSSTLQQELDSYYKLIASEEDPEDLTTSEDQDSEAAPPSATVTRALSQTKVENPPEKKAKLEIAPPPVKTPIRPVVPDVSGEDIDDSDMACEVPEVLSRPFSQISGWNFMQTSYALNQSHWSSNRQPSGLVSLYSSIGKNQSKETHVTTAVAAESSMEDLVTCDSD